ncbi:uncharacterized protein LOC127864730 [Dreissena polymorpha]|uniref:uncharacterized protein LOC127864730 n=1 Tax=Dreissena polymorpha TaxID=45954 RepID=UPI002264357A|nr:uncharacterized protein LOC127864730 [Dreissena polymorpha]
MIHTFCSLHAIRGQRRTSGCRTLWSPPPPRCSTRKRSRMTETEVEEGLLKAEDSIARQAIWLRRNIEDIGRQESSYELSSYDKCRGAKEKVDNAHRMMRELKEHRIEGRMHSNQILLDNVHWVGREGIKPDFSEEHRKYLARLCNDFVDNMISLVTKAIRNRKLLHDRLTEECLQHIRLCQDMCAEFHGRTETLEVGAHIFNHFNI